MTRLLAGQPRREQLARIGRLGCDTRFCRDGDGIACPRLCRSPALDTFPVGNQRCIARLRRGRIVAGTPRNGSELSGDIGQHSIDLVTPIGDRLGIGWTKLQTR